MSVTVTSPISNGYVPNGATRAFAFNFKVATTAEIAVYQVLAGVATLINPSAYAVVLDVDGEGGTVTFTVAPAAGTGTIYLVSAPLLTQTLAFASSDGPFTPSILNGALDRAAIRVVFLNFQVNRSLKVPLNETDPGYPAAADRANNYLTHDGAGKPIPGISNAGIAGMLSNISANALAIANEATTRGNADAAETAARVSGDNNLAATIATETGARITAVNNEASTRSNADVTESSARALGDAALGTRIDTEANARSTADAGLLLALSGVSLTTATLNAANRTFLAALDHTLGLPAFLMEAGREGMFVWNSGNVKSFCDVDTLQGIYVAPASDTTGASGAWVRQFSGPIDIRWFGAVGDCTAFGVGTDNSPAINCAKAVAKLLGNGAALLIPKSTGLYRCASAINFTEHVQLLGQGHGQNPGLVAGTTYTAPANYRGSVLVFDADVGGLIFTAYTDHAANAPVTQYESSGKSVVRDLMVIGGGGVGTTAHGIDTKVGLKCDNVRATGFAGNGLNIVANTSGSSQYGNADEGIFTGCMFDANKLHGLKLDGNDANNITFTACSFTNNGGCGTLDLTTVGCNMFLGCQWATNNRSHPSTSASGYSAAQIALVQSEAPCLTDNFTGSAVMYRGKDYSGNDIGNTSGYHTCYVEGGGGSLARLRGNTKVIGGYLAQVNVRHSEYTADTWGVANELKGVKDFYSNSAGVFNFNDAGFNIVRTSGTTIPKLTLTPSGATYSQLAMQGTGGSAALGFDLLAGGGNAIFSADVFTFRNGAQSASFVTIKSTGIAPAVDNTMTSGAAGFRWSQVYAGTATINTSDERHKTSIETPNDALLDAWSEVDWQTFQFKDAVKAKGKDGARLHIGVIAQRVRDTFAKHGLDGFSLGLLCHDKWEDQFEQKFGERTFAVEEQILEPGTKRGYRIEKRKERRIVPLTDKKGEPIMRRVRKAGDAFGVRYEEALSLEAALQRRTNERLEARLVALEQLLAV